MTTFITIAGSFIATFVLSWGLWIAILALVCKCDEGKKGGQDGER